MDGSDPPLRHIGDPEPKFRHLPQILQLLLLTVSRFETFAHVNVHIFVMVDVVQLRAFAYKLPVEAVVVGGCVHRTAFYYVGQGLLLLLLFFAGGQHESMRGGGM